MFHFFFFFIINDYHVYFINTSVGSYIFNKWMQPHVLYSPIIFSKKKKHISLSIYNHIFLYKRGREHLENGLVCSHSLSLSLILQRILPSQGHFWGILLGHPHTYLRNHFRCSITLPRNPHRHSWGTLSSAPHSSKEPPQGHSCGTISGAPLLFRGTVSWTLSRNHLKYSTTLLRNYLRYFTALLRSPLRDTFEEPFQGHSRVTILGAPLLSWGIVSSVPLLSQGTSSCIYSSEEPFQVPFDPFEHLLLRMLSLNSCGI